MLILDENRSEISNFVDFTDKNYLFFIKGLKLQFDQFDF